VKIFFYIRIIHMENIRAALGKLPLGLAHGVVLAVVNIPPIPPFPKGGKELNGGKFPWVFFVFFVSFVSAGFRGMAQGRFKPKKIFRSASNGIRRCN
jgi:hypothetical protein